MIPLFHVRRMRTFEARRAYLDSMEFWILKARRHTLKRQCQCVWSCSLSIMYNDDNGGPEAVQWAKSELARATPSLRCKEENFIWGTSLRQSQPALVMVDATVPGIIKGQPCQPCCSTSKACHKSQQIDRQAPTLNICPLLILWKRQNFESDPILKFNTKWFILRCKTHPSISQSVIYFFKVAYVHSWLAC